MTATASRSSSGPITQLSTLRNNSDGRVLWPTVLLVYVLPALVGVAAWLAGVRITGTSDLTTGVSILAGFLFGLVLFVFDLRLRLSRPSTVQRSLLLPRLIDELFANVAYSVAVAVVLALVSVVGGALIPPATKDDPGGLPPLASGVLVALSLHFVAMLFVCLRRTRSAYVDLRKQPDQIED